MRFTPIVKNLLILNIAFYVVVQLDVAYGASVYGGSGGYLGLENLLALHYPTSPLFKPVQLVTHFFMHANLMHIFFNMFALVMFGPPLETMWGPKRFLTYYIACAFGSAALHLGYTWWDMNQMQDMIAAFQASPSMDIVQDFFSGTRYNLVELKANLNNGESLMNQLMTAKRDAIMLGASGAVYGLLLAFGMKFPDYRLMLIFLPVPIKARYFIPVLIVVELFLGFQQYSWDPIAHFAHLGGALIGFLMIIYWRRFDPPTGQRWN